MKPMKPKIDRVLIRALLLRAQSLNDRTTALATKEGVVAKPELTEIQKHRVRLI